jgi:hypothetical protein
MSSNDFDQEFHETTPVLPSSCLREPCFREYGTNARMLQALNSPSASLQLGIWPCISGSESGTTLLPYALLSFSALPDDLSSVLQFS